LLEYFFKLLDPSYKMTQKPLSILISGGGIAGSTLALILASHPSFNPRPIITLIERSSQPRTTGQAIDIRGPAVTVIRKLDLEAKIKELHTTEVGTAFINASGAEIVRFNATSNGDGSGMTSEYEILRGELAALLLQQVDEVKEREKLNVQVVYGETIESLNEKDDGVTVEFSNGKLEAQTFDVVVAADGMSSTTRPMIFGEYASQECFKPTGLYIAYFIVPRVEEDNDLWNWYNAPNGLAVHIRPHRNKTTMGVYLALTNEKVARSPELDEAISKDVSAQKTLLRSRFKNAGWQTERLLDGMDQASDFYMQQSPQVKTPQWSKGRCTLLGDSAYCTMGMGTSLAIIGAYVIAGELATIDSYSSPDITAALKRYDDVFRPFVRDCQKLPPGIFQLVNPQTKFGIGVRNTVLRIAYWSGLSKLLQGLGDEGKWKLPSYGW
jgi:2-polyprenyl-6-methoxyphenol hydroxylase-like FAD-dependent oxidoreductase